LPLKLPLKRAEQTQRTVQCLQAANFIDKIAEIFSEVVIPFGCYVFSKMGELVWNSDCMAETVTGPFPRVRF
jgi:hypothetical protein